jgi:hypothetical protein
MTQQQDREAARLAEPQHKEQKSDTEDRLRDEDRRYQERIDPALAGKVVAHQCQRGEDPGRRRDDRTEDRQHQRGLERPHDGGVVGRKEKPSIGKLPNWAELKDSSTTTMIGANMKI